jgi:glycine/D-amino acid oxidase-like deaminating enzyme
VSDRHLEVDAVIFGGGAAGLWLLDHLAARGYQVVLLEAQRLGQGQTVAAQGIIHGGLKYTLDGAFTASAGSIAEMPLVWRDALAGTRGPDLRNTRVRAEVCHLWRTDALMSRLGMLGARAGLKVKPAKLPREAWPAALADCPGDVFRLDEQVIDPVSFVRDLATQHRDRILAYDPAQARLAVDAIAVGALVIRPRRVVLTAGAGNAALRRGFGLADEATQRRPLHMVMVRGAALPELNGHCTDGAKTRVTITSDRDRAGRVIWQVGGQLAEHGVELEPEALVAHARTELAACLPGLDLAAVELATYRIDRAERASGGKRPDDISVIEDGPILTAWPTKLALAPRLAIDLERRLGPPAGLAAAIAPAELARPDVAPPPWDEDHRWIAGR